MVYINAALFLGAAAALAHAHPGSHAGIPKLMGRDGPIDIQSLADRSMLAKRVVSPDETCGGTNAYTCGTSKCCSQYGACTNCFLFKA